MDAWTIWLIFGGVALVMFINARKQPPAEPNPHIVCQHCHVQGQVFPTLVRRKQGISGGKATGAVLTGGVSLVATGLSRKQTFTNMRCGNCGTTWDVA